MRLRYAGVRGREQIVAMTAGDWHALAVALGDDRATERITTWLRANGIDGATPPVDPDALVRLVAPPKVLAALEAVPLLHNTFVPPDAP